MKQKIAQNRQPDPLHTTRESGIDQAWTDYKSNDSRKITQNKLHTTPEKISSEETMAEREMSGEKTTARSEQKLIGIYMN